MTASEPCASCGHAIPSDVQFCPECGAIVVRGGTKREDRLNQSFDVPPSIFPAGGGDGEPPTRSKALLAIIPATVLIVLAGAAFVMWPSPKTGVLPVPGEPAAEPTRAATTEAPTPEAATQPARPPVAAIPQAPANAIEEPPLAPEPPHGHEAAAAPREQASAPPPPAERHVDATDSESSAVTRSRPEPASKEPTARHARAADDGAPRWYRIRFRAPLFDQPSETAVVLSYLPAGTRIRVTRQAEGFLAVESVTGKQPGYVSRDDAVPESVAGAR